MYNTIIFDMDGTLLNTLEDLADSTNFALKRYGYPSRTIEEVRNFVGNGVRKLIERAIPDGENNPDFLPCLRDFKEHYSQNMCNKTKPYDGILTLLKDLKDSGIKTAIVSNKFDAAVKNLSKKYFGSAIDLAVGESEKIRKKPAPDSVLAVIESLNTAKSEVLYVGDSDVDIQTAKNAGVTSVGVTWGFRNRELLETEGANYIIDTPEELLLIQKSPHPAR